MKFVFGIVVGITCYWCMTSSNKDVASNTTHEDEIVAHLQKEINARRYMSKADTHLIDGPWASKVEEHWLQQKLNDYKKTH